MRNLVLWLSLAVGVVIAPRCFALEYCLTYPVAGIYTQVGCYSSHAEAESHMLSMEPNTAGFQFQDLTPAAYVKWPAHTERTPDGGAVVRPLYRLHEPPAALDVGVHFYRCSAVLSFLKDLEASA